MAIHGAPSRFQSDQGTQLVAAAKQIRTWDWSKVHSEVGARGAEWHLVPTGAQHFNGQAERIKTLSGTSHRRKEVLLRGTRDSDGGGGSSGK